MKRFIIVIFLVLILIVALFITKTTNGGTDEPTTEPTTEAVETTTEVEEETTKVEVETTEYYENSNLYEKLEIKASDIPFSFGYSKAVEKVYMYIPTSPRGDADVWDNTYIVVEHKKDYPVCLKFDKADGINTGNIIPKKEMESANWTFFYFDGIYSQDYTMDCDGDMLIFKDFPEAKKIKMKNRSPMPIYVGDIAGRRVSVNTIIVKVVD